MIPTADVEDYWRSLVKSGASADVDLVGHPDMGRAFNQAAYQVRLRAIEAALSHAGCDPRGARVFEAAYGVGFYLGYWESIGCRHVAGIDLSPDAHAEVSARFPGFDLRLGNLAQLSSLPDWANLRARFDLVTAIDVLYHIVDDGLVSSAIQGLAELTAPGGFLLLTEKFTGLTERHHESPIVVRRPRSFYDALLGPNGFEHVGTYPIFWCMDPPTSYGGPTVGSRLARVLWISMRASLKYWPANSGPQNAIGRIVGGIGRSIDATVVPRLATTPNLSAAIYKKAR